MTEFPSLWSRLVAYWGVFWLRINGLSTGKKIFYSFIFGTIVIAVISCATRQYWLTQIISQWTDIHVFNSATRIYFELLIWVLIITAVQFYMYYYNTLGLYDNIVVSKASSWVQVRHIFLQLALSIVIFCAALVLFFTFFLSTMTIQIMNDHNVDAPALMQSYLPIFRLDFLLIYFVLMDFFLICISFNFTSCSECDPDTRYKLEAARQEIGLSFVLGFILCGVNFVALWLNFISIGAYHRNDNLEVSGAALTLLFCIGVLQFSYVAIDLYLTMTKRAPQTTSV